MKDKTLIETASQYDNIYNSGKKYLNIKQVEKLSTLAYC